MSSEYAKAVFSPLTARTPTPWSMLKLPDLTMPSSRLQPSLRRVLEIQIGVVDFVRDDLAEHLLQRGVVKRIGREQRRLRGIECGLERRGSGFWFCGSSGHPVARFTIDDRGGRRSIQARRLLGMRTRDAASGARAPAGSCAAAAMMFGIDAGDHDAGAARQAIQHDAPRIDDHAVAVRFAAVRSGSRPGPGAST